MKRFTAVLRGTLAASALSLCASGATLLSLRNQKLLIWQLRRAPLLPLLGLLHVIV